MDKTKANLIRMIKNTSKHDYKEVINDFPRDNRVRGWSLKRVLLLAKNNVSPNIDAMPERRAYMWRTIFAAFVLNGNKGKQSRPDIANKPVRKRKKVRKKAIKQASRKKAVKRGGDLRAKRMKLSKLKKQSVAEERANFGLIWKLRKLQLLNLFNHHFPDG